ncbi:hypothetical protein COLINT_03559 [Collinsella intestinalis DSM 13280]|uniref:Uncharacterized protein n=1 Tax=Collinsella intestinalis DSM 13280 TaxID=521003 RepID=C4FBU6_9ACTN|nr:hypothetical protein COLINT_03559 [Collinsella intestinalis DSM 13280]
MSSSSTPSTHHQINLAPSTPPLTACTTHSVGGVFMHLESSDRFCDCQILKMCDR